MRRLALTVLTAGLSLAVTAPIQAQTQSYQLFDKFSIALSGDFFLDLQTTIRLDSDILPNQGTTINFESDLGLDASTITPGLALEWRVGKRHLIGGSWFKYDRNSTTQVLTEIQFGDLVIPIDELVFLSIEQEEFRLGYLFYPVVKPRTAFGVGIGLRLLDYAVILEALGLEQREDAAVDAPLPFLGLDLRHMLSKRWRLLSSLGWLTLSTDTASGSQLILKLGVEHLTFKDVSFGLNLLGSSIDIDVDDRPLFRGSADVDSTGFSIFVKGRV